MALITIARSARPWTALVCAGLFLWPGLAAAFNEVEPNDTWAAAQAINNPAGDFVIDGGRPDADGSDDFFSFVVRGPGVLRIEASSPNLNAQAIMGLFNAGGGLLASADGGGANPLSFIEYTVGAAGTYGLGFSGFNPGLLSCTATVTQCYDTNDDFVFDTFVAGGGMGGSRAWDYRLTLSGVALVPEPHAGLLFAPGLAWLLLMRRRRPGPR